MEWVTTSTILKGLKDFDNQDAWGRLVSRFRRPIEAFGRTLGLAPADAEELAQVTLSEFVKVMREGRYEREKGRLRSYLFGIAHRQALRLMRENGHARPAMAEPPPDEATMSVVWDEAWERAVVAQCLERVRAEVDPDAFAAFELVVQRDWTPAAAAEELGVPVKFVYNAKHRVLTRLRTLRAELEALDDEPGLS